MGLGKYVFGQACFRVSVILFTTLTKKYMSFEPAIFSWHQTFWLKIV